MVRKTEKKAAKPRVVSKPKPAPETVEDLVVVRSATEIQTDIDVLNVERIEALKADDMKAHDAIQAKMDALSKEL